MEISSDSSVSLHSSDCRIIVPKKKGSKLSKDSDLKAPSKAASTIVAKDLESRLNASSCANAKSTNVVCGEANQEQVKFLTKKDGRILIKLNDETCDMTVFQRTEIACSML